MQSDIIPILVVYNPAARGGKNEPLKELYLAFLEKQHLRYTTYITDGDEEESGIAETCKLYSCSIISVIGGDGTFNLVINALDHFNVSIHLIPAGSGNDLAKMIYPNGIPSYTDLFQYVLRKKPITKSIDIWRCNDQLFANGFGCGFDGSIAYDTKFKKGLLGTKTKYWVEILKHIFFYTSPDISVNGKAYATFMLSAANGSVYGGDFKVAPNASISDGKLDIVRIKKVWVPLRLFYLPLVIMGKHLSTSIAEHEQLDQLTIVANKPIPAHLDGEPMSEKKYVISLEGKVKVLY
ncbi:MAG: diacylglycerol kinase family enzyme [Bacteroidia bacterium]|jgi:diacylglycerol kinase family enzyme